MAARRRPSRAAASSRTQGSLPLDIRIVLFCLAGLGLMLASFWTFLDDLHPFYQLWLVAFLLTSAPFFLLRDLCHPLIVNGAWQILILFHFWNKGLSHSHLRYAPEVQGSDTLYWLAYALGVYTLWYLMALIGIAMSRAPRPRSTPAPLTARRRYEYQIAALGLLAVSLSAFVYALGLTGGLAGMIESMVSRREVYAGYGYLRPAVQLGAAAAVLLLLAGHRGVSVAIALATTAMVAPFGGRGAAIIGVLLPYLVAYHYNVRALSVRIGAGVVAASVIFAVGWGNLRQAGEWRLGGFDPYTLAAKAASDTGQAESLPALLRGLENGAIEFNHGAVLFNFFYGMVPRALWPEKPIIPPSSVIGQALLGEHDYYGTPVGPYGLAFFNFSWIGVLAMGMISGLLVAWLYGHFVSRLDRDGGNAPIVVVYPFLVFGIFNLFDADWQVGTVFKVTLLLAALMAARPLAELLRPRHATGDVRRRRPHRWHQQHAAHEIGHAP